MSNRPALFAFRKVAVAVMLAAAMPAAMAWTSKPVRMLVPAPAGGTMDVIARVLAEQLSADLGQPVVVDNKPGASGGIAINTLLAAPPDGQTILVTLTNVFTEVPHVMKVSFDPVKDVRPVAAVSKVTMVLVASTDLPARDLPGLIRYVKANPGKLSFASPSAGTVGHYAGMIMNQKAGMDLQHVPFPGSPPGLTQVMGGQITVMYDNMVTSLPLIKAGKLRPYALAAKQRSPLLPQVPTFAELGYPDIDFSNWGGVFVSAKVPADLSQKIQAAVYKAASKPRVQERFMALGMEPAPAQGLPELSQALRTEFDRNAGIVKAFHIQP
ncbi:tripartite tricarboxylate transporter substrate binding protein [Cupriavidus sp. UYPR2.512]|uniref:tripartite tricarboxylate transporter substrate binding protein n=1 Tax=Cupriavidus sp. UYPR2.512 TaxID=1080187 RepID=UPI000377D8E2|nr:tripartite tricarboxylate transporter substrate binding protein [Cupriavidus sp. UYPR2.512]UIF91528.1 tripartite tricarboxylate transporter substrate binding protein [Cupriavidus necator]